MQSLLKMYVDFMYYHLFSGHIGIAVPNVEKACERFEEKNVEFVKRPNDGM